MQVVAPSCEQALSFWKRDSLARPYGRVVFAGEHTSRRWQGYMNGAVESGQRAAVEIQTLARVNLMRLCHFLVPFVLSLSKDE